MWATAALIWVISLAAMVNGNHFAAVEKMEDLMPLMQEALQAGQSVRFSPRGTSMLPLIRQGRDQVVLAPVSAPLRKYDIALYQRTDGKYVLHRAVKIPEPYIFLGDNQFVTEPGVHQEQMIGIVTGIYRDDVYCSVEHPGYRLYCILWCRTRGIRHFLHRGFGWLRRHFS